jgi:hypothetical protein
MAVNLIVLAVTLLVGAYLVVWIFFPGLRAWMEMPKYRFLERERQFGTVSHEIDENAVLQVHTEASEP